MREIGSNIFLVTLLVSVVILIWGIIKPSSLPKMLQKITPSRKRVAQVFGILSVVSFFCLGIVAPSHDRTNVNIQNTATTKQAINDTQDAQPIKKDIVEVKQDVETKPVSFAVTTQDDSSLPKGQTKVLQEGKDGVETFTYSVTYTNGKETSRALVSQVVTSQPTPKVIANGTYVTPAPVKPSCGSGYYLNSDNICVHSPSSNPTGATARCVDGTYSYSLHRSGTCSHHGGVAEWL